MKLFSRTPGALRAVAATAAAGLIALTVSACGANAGSGAAESSSPGPDASGAAAEAFPVKVKSVYGETEIKEEPERVVSVSWVNGDTALALGVVPVAVPKVTWGMNANNSTDWADAKLDSLGAGKGSDKAPTFFDEPVGDVAYDAIADADPDVILAAYSGLTKEQYEKLSKIAPVVGPGVAAYGTPWEQSTEMIGQALGKSAEAKQLITDTEATIKKAADANPQLKGKTFIAGNFEPNQGGINVYTSADNRPRLLTALGMKEAPVVKANEKPGAFFFNYSAEKADELDSQIFFTWFPEGQNKESIEKDKLLNRIPAITKGGLVGTSDNQLLLSVSAANPLSLAWGADKIAALVGNGADVVEGK
ncbi:ABC transporter substrate-binding protein [Galactobacter caseinivorans]|uniref:ABC transporter substrate-binding protein n=1 Tax=Galactobacter caseinivorans TaxID=2676123 RepID=A0A496PIL4_9MICC|nr:ABC transporter substrate-binding protein [Galactobacter caseinivorans]RKW70280.1 ABC transporter substrate-binding protein [Galactobacter caseinivorans]